MQFPSIGRKALFKAKKTIMLLNLSDNVEHFVYEDATFEDQSLLKVTKGSATVVLLCKLNTLFFLFGI